MSETKTTSKIYVLCVDDEEAILAFLTPQVEKLGFSVLTALSGPDALALIQEHSAQIALVVSDFAMPGWDGFELRRQMMVNHTQIPFILISGHITREEALSAIELKISGFIEKPFDSQKISDSILRETSARVAAIKDEDEMLTGFAQEARAMLEEMESLLLSLEGSEADQESINRVFACAHTIKGTSGFFKPDTVHRFTHRFEDYLSQFKKGYESLGQESIGVLLKGIDLIRELIEDLANRRTNPTPIETLCQIFEHTKKEGPALAKTQTAGPQGPKQPAKTEDELRVSVSLLNEFMEKSGELTVLRNMVNKTLRMIEAERPGDGNIASLSELLAEMHKVNGSIQDQIVDLRKLPLRQVLKPLHRTMRDLCVNLKKQIVIEATGDQIRIDHTLAETLSRCLIHLIRNSADHGIEGPEEREKLGKPAQGKIQIEASEGSESVVLRISDDGRGIDPERVGKKALKSHLISEEDLAQLSKSEIQALIFEPGFSTAENVTDVSGRGVGTDMVRSTITQIGGRIDLKSEVGVGTEFLLHLPIPKSVLIESSLMVRANGQVFGVSSDTVYRVVNLDDEAERAKVKPVGDAFVYEDTQALLPVINLGQLLKLAETRVRALLLIRSKKAAYCLGVEEVFDIEDTVVKPAGHWLKDLPVYSGATFLADGRIGMILNSDGIAELAQIAVESRAKIAATSSQVAQSHESILLFRLHQAGLYGAKQSEIFRLEEFQSSSVQYSGGLPVIIYRDQSMPIFALGALLKKEAADLAEEISAEKTLQTVIVKKGEQFFGLVVDSVQDLVDTEKLESESDICIIRGQTVTLIKLKEMIKTAA